MASEETTIGQRSVDFPNQFAIGVNSSVKALTDFFGADNPVSQNLNKNIEWYRSLLSAQAQKNEAEIARILQEAEGKGVLEELGAGVSAFATAPADFVASGLGSVATFAATGIAGRAVGFLKSTQITAGMTMGSGAVKGQIYETVKEEMTKMGKDEKEAQKIAMEAQSTLGKNLPNILAGAGLGAVNARTGAELIISKVLTKGGLEASASRIGNIMANGFMEGAPELAQSAQQKFSENLSLRLEGVDVPLTRGLYAQATVEGLSGTGLGMLAGGIEPRVKGKDATENKKMSIYFDLDETLIHAQNVDADAETPSKKLRITLNGRTDGREEHYDSLLRPHAKHMLAFCRELGDVKLLTTANREYAMKHNLAFELGFDQSQILAREDYLSRTDLEFGPVYATSQNDTDPNAFLIDNLRPDEDGPKLKMKFLGINEENYIQIREFRGDDPKVFTQELSQILTNLENIKLGKKIEKPMDINMEAPFKEEVNIESRLNIEILETQEGPDLNSRLASKLHEVWLENHRNGPNNRKYKPVSDPDIEDLEILSFRGRRIPLQDVLPNAKRNDKVEHITQVRTKDGQEFDVSDKKLYDCRLEPRDDPQKGAYLTQNIAQDPRLLNPALMEKLNGKMANKYLETIVPDIMEMDKKSFDRCLEDISSQIHDAWLDENKDWAPEDQKVPYSQLPEHEKEKDRQVARALFETAQEVKAIEKLKGIEVEARFEPLNKLTNENIKKASDWIRQVNECGKHLSNSPWHREPSNTLDKLRLSMASEVYQNAYKEFERILIGEEKATKIIDRKSIKPQKPEYEPSMVM
jgi:hypothetical protein